MSTPAWLSDDASAAAAPPAAPMKSAASAPAASSSVAAPASNVSSGPAPPYKGVVNAAMTLVTMGVAIMMAACGAFIVRDSRSVTDTGMTFIGIYMVLFAAILFCYELIQVKPIATLDNIYKENFGFLYGPNGRGIYMFFIAIIAFGIKDDGFALATGFTVGIWGVVVIAVHMKFSRYFDKKEKYVPHVNN